MLYPNPNILLRIAQADAYAAGVEYVKLPAYQDLVDEALKFEKYVQHPTHGLPAGKYTDDTQMSIAITEALINNEDNTIFVYADYFLKTFQRDPRNGYARGFQKFLEGTETTEDFLKNIISTSEKNGAAMRAMPIGMIPDVKKVIATAEMQARVTHDSPIGRWSSIAVALMSHFAHHINDDFTWLAAYVNQFMPKEYKEFALEEKPDFNKRITNTMSTVQSVRTAIVNNDSLIGMLKQIIEWGGDTDSAAAIAWGIASARYPDEVLPEFLEAALEPYGQYGVSFLKDLGQHLVESME